MSNDASPLVVCLWRAVKDEELADISNRYTFRSVSGIENKYFATTPEGATSYAHQAYRAWPHEGPYTLIETSIEERYITPEMRIMVDRGLIQTIVIPDTLLVQLTRPVLLSAMPIRKR